MITFNWQYRKSNRFFLLSFTFHPDAELYDNVWIKKGSSVEVTWTPKHLEQGYISELLALANQINGLPVSKREKLCPIIDRNVKEDFEFKLTEENVNRIIRAFKEIEGLYE